VISPYTVISKSIITFFNISISVIIVAEFKDIVIKFVAIKIKISIVNVFLAHDIRSIAKDFDFFRD
jgi:hypothetical protein